MQKTLSHIVLITAHEQYAIKAFRLSAWTFARRSIRKNWKVIGTATQSMPTGLCAYRFAFGVNNSWIILGVIALRLGCIPFCLRLRTSTASWKGRQSTMKFYIKNNKPVLISKTLERIWGFYWPNIGFESNSSIAFDQPCRTLKLYIKKRRRLSVVMSDNSHFADWFLPTKDRFAGTFKDHLNKFPSQKSCMPNRAG